MKVRIVSIITLILLTANAFAFPNGKIEKVSDDVLEDVYAQGFFTNWQIIGNFSGNTFNVAGDFTNKIRINANINYGNIKINNILKAISH